MAGRCRRPPPRVRGGLRRARRRVHPAGGGHRRATVDRRGDHERPTGCSTGSGMPTPAGSSPPATTPNSSSHGRRSSSTTQRRRPTASPAVALLRLAALTGNERYREHAEDILRLVGGAAGRAPHGVRPRARRPSTSTPPASPRSSSPATDPTSWPRCTAASSRTRCSRGASRTSRRCGRAVTHPRPTCAATTSASSPITDASAFDAALSRSLKGFESRCTRFASRTESSSGGDGRQRVPGGVQLQRASPGRRAGRRCGRAPMRRHPPRARSAQRVARSARGGAAAGQR